MQQAEIDEISEAFSDAWRDYFGDLMYYVRFNRKDTSFDTTYNESKKLSYDMDNKIPFYGALKDLEKDDTIEPYGDDETKLYSITFVMKELIDKGQFDINHDDLIIYEQKVGDMLITRKFSIYSSLQKVQFNATKIFGNLKVREDVSSRNYSLIPRVTEGQTSNVK